MRGELPKVGETITALLPGANVLAKIDLAARSSSPFNDELDEVAVKVQADEV
jgi:hypothetical protein